MALGDHIEVLRKAALKPFTIPGKTISSGVDSAKGRTSDDRGFHETLNKI
jgi:hypothetical protein